ncbi:aspartyl-tRNA(Asn)/glutamyl-tRNA(Gln) amidotransferase subunit A [Enhydrobacter aerosaccus]|uniref:Indoleacetamide hydrolase n=1 Tax=Enhydrobacter aerosaccus TaxID=225324 RepID=A0A1T4L4F2_9HYPH|nr:amidase [Enhydrobacter aerosaccus]SJZ49437.1 aspartyl-tRNA(Asn)/glutamyl-tRNA(Gln) amidotransferase subunit A [Enhydrobacter aerosaccus]
MSALHALTLTELAAGLSAKRFSSRELVDALLARIAKADAKLHAFTEVYAKEARALAEAADTARSSGFPLGSLHGLPIAYKDLCDIAGRIGTGGSKMYEARKATETSNTVERLTAAGMIPLGKLHMVEFAFGGWGTNPLMGAPWNPWDLQTHRVPGGSSSGTGVAVAARLVPAGIGSDTGGSVRIPSAFNGLVGLKVTYGRIGLSGTMLLSWTLDSIGPMARSVEDCALLLNALAAPDARDPMTLGQPLEDFTLATRPASIEGMRLALPDSRQLPEFMHPHVAQAWQTAARTFEGLGATVEAVKLPDWYFDLSRPAGTIIASEAFSLHRGYIEDSTKAIGSGVRGRALAAKQLAPGAYAEEIRAMADRRRSFADWFRSYDAILMPTVAVPAIPLADVDEASPIPGYLTRPANYLGLCSLAMPSGQSDGLPLGIQIVGKPFAERDVLRLGKAFQDATDFHRRAPNLSALGI